MDLIEMCIFIVLSGIFFYVVVRTNRDPCWLLPLETRADHYDTQKYEVYKLDTNGNLYKSD